MTYHDLQTFQFNGLFALALNRDGYANGGELALNGHPGYGVDVNVGPAYDNFWVKNINLATGGFGDHARR